MKSAEEIRNLFLERAKAQGPFAQVRREFREVYEGDVVLPLPELEKHERPFVANLAQQGLDQLGRRLASVEPAVYYPPLRTGIQASEDRARQRHHITMGWWAEDKLRKQLYRRGRWFFGYGSAPSYVRPDFGCKRPVVKLSHPDDTFPSPGGWDDITPHDCIHRARKPLAWLKANYPEQARAIYKGRDDGHCKDDKLFNLLTHDDGEWITLVLIAADPEDAYQRGPISADSKAVVLERIPNLAGVCLSVCPGRITLDRPMGHFDSVLGMYKTRAELMSLNIIATRRAIWPREWLVANPNEVPQVIQVPDPASGTPGVLKGGSLDRQQLDPTYRALEVMDRLEASERMTASLPAEFGGMGAVNVRTARRGAQVIGAAVDPVLAEAQDVFAEALHEENVRRSLVDKAWFGGEKKTFYINTRAFSGKVDYDPEEVWECTYDADGRTHPAPHTVKYAMTGLDEGNLVIEAGQRVGMGTMSKRTFMELDPAVDDPEAEDDRLKAERLGEAFFASVEQMAATPEGPYQPIHFGRLAKKIIAENKPWWQAIEELQRELQEEQAEGAQEPADAMPGLSMPGMGAELPGMPGLGPSAGELEQLLSTLGTTQQAMRSRPMPPARAV